jgi:hypothetical protein
MLMMDYDLDLLLLGAPAGNGRQNNPDDIEALDGALRQVGAYAPPPEYAGGPQRYATEPMIGALERFQEQNGLKIDGYAEPGGPTERAINNRLLGKPKGAGLLFEPPPALSGTVGNGFANKREDVAAVQRMLGALDYMPEHPFDRPAGFIDERTTEATRRFQRDRGLAPDGWMAPGGETETALRSSIADLARASARDWFDFAGRAGKTQANLIDRLDLRTPPAPAAHVTVDRHEGESDGAPPRIEPVNWAPDRNWRGRAEMGGPRGYGGGSYSRSAPTPPSSPGLSLAQLIAAAIAAAGASRTASESPGSDRTEYIPPHVPNEPFRGPDPLNPPLKPHEVRPAPSPSEPPDKVPNKEEIVPPRLDPREYIEILPDQSELTAQLPIIVENRQGGLPVKELNRAAGARAFNASEKVFGKGSITQTGGPTPDPNKTFSEDFDPFRYKEAYGITSNAAGSFKDVSYQIEYKGVRVQLVINSVNVSGPDSAATPRENRQRAKMVLNARDHTLIVEVDKLRPNETIDLNEWERFVELRLRYVKKLIDKGVLTNKRNHRIIDQFKQQ